MLNFDIAHLAKLAHAKSQGRRTIPSIFRSINARLKRERILFFIQQPSTWLLVTTMSWLVLSRQWCIRLVWQTLYNLKHDRVLAVLFPFDSYLPIRGLKTLSIRMERSTENVSKVVEFENLLRSKKSLLLEKVEWSLCKVQDEKILTCWIPPSLYSCRKPWRSWKFDHLSYHPTHADILSSSFIWFDRWSSSVVHRNRRCDDLIEDLKQALEVRWPNMISRLYWIAWPTIPLAMERNGDRSRNHSSLDRGHGF